MDRRTSRSGSPMTRIARVLLGLLAIGVLAGCVAPRTPLQTIPEVPIAIPEPGHAVLLLCGIVGLALLSRLRGVA